MKKPPNITVFEVFCLIFFPIMFCKSFIFACMTGKFYHVFFATLWFGVSIWNISKILPEENEDDA
jgi:hypothetical protein